MISLAALWGCLSGSHRRSLSSLAIGGSGSLVFSCALELTSRSSGTRTGVLLLLPGLSLDGVSLPVLTGPSSTCRLPDGGRPFLSAMATGWLDNWGLEEPLKWITKSYFTIHYYMLNTISVMKLTIICKMISIFTETTTQPCYWYTSLLKECYRSVQGTFAFGLLAVWISIWWLHYDWSFFDFCMQHVMVSNHCISWINASSTT